VVVGRHPHQLAAHSPLVASSLDLIAIRRELTAALDLLNFDGLP